MTGRPAHRAAWALVTLLVLTLVAAALWSARQEDPTRPLGPAAGDVVVVGVPGLTWEHIGEDTPQLGDLAGQASGTLVVRSADRATCPAQGWLTLGAGQRAGAGLATDCLSPDVTADGSPVGWALWQEAARTQSLTAELGTLATAAQAGGTCVTASGPLAALGAADATGTVAGYSPDGLLQAVVRDAGAGPAAECLVHLVSAPAVLEGDRSGTLQAVDEALGLLREDLPPDTTVVVAGLADTNARPELHAVLIGTAGGDPLPPGLLTSPSTRQPGLVQTTDLTATLLTLVGLETPAAVAGAPVSVQPTSEPVAHHRDLSAAGTRTTALLPWMAGLLALLLVPALLVSLHRRAARRRRGAPAGPGRLPAVLGTAAMAVPAGSFLAGLLPWWRAGQPALGLALATVAMMGLLLLVAWGGPWRRDPRGPVAVVAALTVAVIGVDVVLGGPLGLIAFLGVQPIEAGRFYGVGNVAFGALSAAALVLAGVLASWLADSRRQATAAVLLVGLGVTLVNGLPAWGADFGGVPALLVATGVLALSVAGIRLSVARLVLLSVAALAVAGAVMVADWLREPQDRSHLGSFVQEVLDGTAPAIVQRKLSQSLGILLDYPASWIAVVILLVLVLAVARPGSRLGAPLAGLWTWPHLRATAWALVACWVIGWGLNDSGIAVVGMGLVVAVGAGLAVALRTPAVRPPAPGQGLDTGRQGPTTPVGVAGPVPSGG